VQFLNSTSAQYRQFCTIQIEGKKSKLSDVVNASSVNSLKGRLDKHWKEFNMFSLELPPKTVTSCHWSAKGHQAYQAAEDGKW